MTHIAIDRGDTDCRFLAYEYDTGMTLQLIRLRDFVSLIFCRIDPFDHKRRPKKKGFERGDDGEQEGK